MTLDESRRVATVQPRDGSVYIRGRVQYATAAMAISPGATKTGIPLVPLSVPAEVHVVYGIEEYFIPEGTGRNFTFTGKNALLHITVGEDGTPMIKELFIDGKKWREQ